MGRNQTSAKAAGRRHAHDVHSQIRCRCHFQTDHVSGFKTFQPSTFAPSSYQLEDKEPTPPDHQDKSQRYCSLSRLQRIGICDTGAFSSIHAPYHNQQFPDCCCSLTYTPRARISAVTVQIVPSEASSRRRQRKLYLRRDCRLPW